MQFHDNNLLGIIRLLLILATGMLLSSAVCRADTALGDSSMFNVDVRFLYVQPGQTLHNIVRRLYPSQEAKWPQIRREIVRLNPSAFVDGKEAGMKAGARLVLPGKEKSSLVSRRVGDVVLAEGQVIAVGPDKISRKLVAGDGVYVGDKLITGEDGFLRLAMIDSARLDLRCFSIMVIEEYTIKNADRRSILKLLQGSLRKVTGEIGKMADDIYELQTPIASIGVRGTEYALRVFQSKGCGGTVDTDDDGLFLQVIKGLVDVKNRAATTEVAKGGQLYIPLPDAAPVNKSFGPHVIEPANTDGMSWWWYALGVVLIVALI